MRYLQSAAIILCMFASSLSAAEEALTVFKAGDKVKAAEINANFELIRAAAADAGSYEGGNLKYNTPFNLEPCCNARFIMELIIQNV